MEGDPRREQNGGVLEESDPESEEPEMWKMLNQRFKEVEKVLDRNRLLIEQVNENHQSKIPDNMVKNVDLINQINSNISQVVSLYSHLSHDFSSACRPGANSPPPPPPSPPPPRSNNESPNTPSQ